MLKLGSLQEFKKKPNIEATEVLNLSFKVRTSSTTPRKNMTAHASNFKEWRFYIKKKIRNFLPTPILNVYFGFYPFVGNLVFGCPSKKIKLIGVTGTDGKSSTVIFITRILQEAGFKVGFFSSIAYSDGNQEQINGFKMTMPGRFFLQRFLKRLVDNKCDFGVIEVTSEGVKQKRNLFIDFDIALITNLKPEHIESHGGFEKYKLAKSVIFRNLIRGYDKGIAKTIIVNNDDSEARSFLQFSANHKMTFGIHTPSDVQGEIIDTGLFQNNFKVKTNDEIANIKISAGGPFVTENALAAISIGKTLGIDLTICVNALEKITNPPGRFEAVSKQPLIIVDYAHTIAAVEKILSFVRENWSGKIIHVFGAAGGGRDKRKRPKLAELSERFSDQTILTEENSFDEPVEDILKDIFIGFKNKNRVDIIPNRTLAVKKAIEIASSSKDTMVLLTAKGSEMVIAGPLGRKTPYNEKQTVLCLLNK